MHESKLKIGKETRSWVEVPAISASTAAQGSLRLTAAEDGRIEVVADVTRPLVALADLEAALELVAKMNSELRERVVTAHDFAQTAAQDLREFAKRS